MNQRIIILSLILTMFSMVGNAADVADGNTSCHLPALHVEGKERVYQAVSETGSYGDQQTDYGDRDRLESGRSRQG